MLIYRRKRTMFYTPENDLREKYLTQDEIVLLQLIRKPRTS